MGAVFSKKSGLNMLFVGCRSLNRSEFYRAKESARFSRRAVGDFSEFIRLADYKFIDIIDCLYPITRYWSLHSLNGLLDCRDLNEKRNIIRWRTEGK